MNGLWFPFPAGAAAVLAVDVLVQLTVVTLAALLVARTAARRHPAARYAVLLGALLCALASPALASVPDRAAGLPATGLPQPAGLVLALWVVGAVVRLARLAAGWRGAARLRRESRPLTGRALDDVLVQVAEALGTTRLPRVGVSPSLRGPVALGPGTPLVVLPEDLARTLTPAQLRDVMVHECAHVSQRHHLILLLQQLAAALFWPHPLVHLLNRELSRAREDVCDNFALRATPAVAYARTLLAVAERVPATPSHPSPLPRFPTSLLPLRRSRRPPALEARVIALLDPRRQAATRLGPLATALLATLLLATAITGAGIRAGEAAVLNRPAVQRSAR